MNHAVSQKEDTEMGLGHTRKDVRLLRMNTGVEGDVKTIHVETGCVLFGDQDFLADVKD